MKAFAILFLTTGITLANLGAQDESTDELVRKLRGQAGQPAAPANGLATRGFKTRSIGGGASTPAPATETRSLMLSRGIPKAVSAAAEEDHVKVEASSGGAVELKYEVDSTSKVARDNILFKKGSAEFADDASVDVVVTLAEALKHPELKGLHFVIEGHASAEGEAGSNQYLSQLRAEEIVNVLTKLGVDGTCLVPVGFGESQARFPDSSPDSLLKQDRRVLIFRLNQ